MPVFASWLGILSTIITIGVGVGQLYLLINQIVMKNKIKEIEANTNHLTKQLVDVTRKDSYRAGGDDKQTEIDNAAGDALAFRQRGNFEPPKA